MAGSFFSRGVARLNGYVSDARKALDVYRATEHLSGPEHISVEPPDTVLVSLMKDASYYLEPFLEHYRKIGVAHFLIIDNGSTDGTPEALAREPDVTVCSNRLPVRKYESLQRRYISRRYISGGWLLFADSDELILPARGEGRQLSDFTAYCNTHGYDGVVCQVIDLFSPHPLEQSKDWSYAKSVSAFDRYSLNSIDSFAYEDRDNIPFSWFLRHNKPSNKDIRFMFGGIRKEVFGENCCLTTHRFVRNARHVKIYSHPHCCDNLTCADFTFVIRHYKFAGDSIARDLKHLANKIWDHGEDVARMAVLQDVEAFVIKGREEHRYQSTDDLIMAGFLACSERFLVQFPPLNATEHPVLPSSAAE